MVDRCVQLVVSVVAVFVVVFVIGMVDLIRESRVVFWKGGFLWRLLSRDVVRLNVMALEKVRGEIARIGWQDNLRFSVHAVQAIGNGAYSTRYLSGALS